MEFSEVNLPEYFRTQFWKDLIEILESYHSNHKESISSANLPIWIYKEVLKKDVMSLIKRKIKQDIKTAMKKEIENLWNTHKESMINEPYPKIKHPKKIITNLIHSFFKKFQYFSAQPYSSHTSDKVIEVDAFMSERYISIWRMIKGLMNSESVDKYFIEIKHEMCANILINIADKNDEIVSENEKLNEGYNRQINAVKKKIILLVSR